MKKLIFLVTLALAFPALADLLPMPSAANIPLHRIGIEVLFETVAVAVGGGLVTRLVLKRGWKLDRKVRGKERKKLEDQLAQVLPDVRAAYEASSQRTSSAVKEMLEGDADLREKLKGVPVEWVDKVCNEGKDEYRFRELRMPTWCSNEDRKNLYAADRFRRKWRGTPMCSLREIDDWSELPLVLLMLIIVGMAYVAYPLPLQESYWRRSGWKRIAIGLVTIVVLGGAGLSLFSTSVRSFLLNPKYIVSAFMLWTAFIAYRAVVLYMTEKKRKITEKKFAALMSGQTGNGQ